MEEINTIVTVVVVHELDLSVTVLFSFIESVNTIRQGCQRQYQLNIP